MCIRDRSCGHPHKIQPLKANTKESTKQVPRLQGRSTSFVVVADGRQLFRLALNRVNVVAVTTTLVLHVVALDMMFQAVLEC